MKKTVMMALVLMISNLAFAGPAKVERELTRDKATEIMGAKDTDSKEKYLSKLAVMAGEAGKINGLSGNIKKALLQGDADLLMLVYKSIAKKDEVQLKFIAEGSAGVKTVKDARGLSKLAEMTYTGNFKAEFLKAIEQGKSVEEATKDASKAIGKTGKDEITLEKILECIA